MSSEDGVSATLGAMVLALITLAICMSVVVMGYAAGRLAPQPQPAIGFMSVGSGATVISAPTDLSWSDFVVAGCMNPALNGRVWPTVAEPLHGGDSVSCLDSSSWGIVFRGTLLYHT